MTTRVTKDELFVSRRQWLWEHSGRLAGFILGLFAIAFFAVLAAAGYTPAALFIPLVIAGFALLVLGGRIHAD